MGGGREAPIEIKEVALMGGNEIADYKSSLNTSIDAFIKRVLPNIKRFDKTSPNTPALPILLSMDKCMIPPKGTFDLNKGEAGFDRIAVILPKSTKHIILFPAVNGDTDVYQSCIQYINEGELDKDENNVIIFSPDFFTVDDFDKNRNLFSNFLKLKIASAASVYLLARHTIPSRIIGCHMNSADNKANAGDLVPTMLEPTYIVYPFPRTIQGVETGGILFSGAATDEVDIPVSSIPSRFASLSEYVSKGNRGIFAFPPNIKQNDTDLGKMLRYRVYRFSGPKAISTKMVTKYTLKRDINIENIMGPFVDPSKFQPTDEAHLILDNVHYTRIPLGGQIFSFRKPGKGVSKDWIAGRFTIDEAAMLNELNMRPYILENIFGDTWNIELNDFLVNMTSSQCFSDKSLLMTTECEKSTIFINKVYAYFLEHDSRIVTTASPDTRIMYEDGSITQTKPISKSVSSTHTSIPSEILAAVPKPTKEEIASGRPRPIYSGIATEHSRLLQPHTRISGLKRTELNRQVVHVADLATTAKQAIQETKQEQVDTKKKLNTQQAALDTHAKAVGIDMTVDLNLMKKNPFIDKRVTYFPGGVSISRTIHRSLYDDKQYSREILALNIRTKEYFRGEVSVPADKLQTAEIKLETEINKLRVEYPAWRFLY